MVGLERAAARLRAPEESVYTRLWCTYEAFLAQEEGKDILIAKASTVGRQLGSLLTMALAACLGAVAGAHCEALQLKCYTQKVPLVTVLLFGVSRLALA